MFISKTGEELKKGMLVGLHFNAHRNDYSVVKMKSKRTPDRVIGYVTKGKIKEAYQVISNSGQKSVRESKQKNRHAFLVGLWEGHDIENKIDGQAYYNPHKVDSFIDYDLYKEKNLKKELNQCEYFQFELTSINEKIKPLVTYKL